LPIGISVGGGWSVFVTPGVIVFAARIELQANPRINTGTNTKEPFLNDFIPLPEPPKKHRLVLLKRLTIDIKKLFRLRFLDVIYPFLLGVQDADRAVRGWAKSFPEG
jgi:hypothetical protein